MHQYLVLYGVEVEGRARRGAVTPGMIAGLLQAIGVRRVAL